MITTIISIIVVLLILFLFVSCIKIVPQEHAYVIERLGKYLCTWHAGLHFKFPIIDNVINKISLKEQVLDSLLNQ